MPSGHRLGTQTGGEKSIKNALYVLNNVVRTSFSPADLHGVPWRARSPGVHGVAGVAVLLEPEVRARVDAAAAHSGAKRGDQKLLVVAADAVLNT